MESFPKQPQIKSLRGFSVYRKLSLKETVLVKMDSTRLETASRVYKTTIEEVLKIIGGQ